MCNASFAFKRFSFCAKRITLSFVLDCVSGGGRRPAAGGGGFAASGKGAFRAGSTHSAPPPHTHTQHTRTMHCFAPQSPLPAAAAATATSTFFRPGGAPLSPDQRG